MFNLAGASFYITFRSILTFCRWRSRVLEGRSDLRCHSQVVCWAGDQLQTLGPESHCAQNGKVMNWSQMRRTPQLGLEQVSLSWDPWSTLSWSSLHKCVWSHFTGVRGTVSEAGGILVGLPRWLSGKESACNAGDTRVTGFILGSGRTTGGGHGNPLQYSCLENLMDRGDWWASVHRVTEIRIQWKWMSTHAQWSKYTGLCFMV